MAADFVTHKILHSVAFQGEHYSAGGTGTSRTTACETCYWIRPKEVSDSSFNAQPEAPARDTESQEAGASGWALNERVIYSIHPAVRDGFLSGLDALAAQQGHEAARTGYIAMEAGRLLESLPVLWD